MGRRRPWLLERCLGSSGVGLMWYRYKRLLLQLQKHCFACFALLQMFQGIVLRAFPILPVYSCSNNIFIIKSASRVNFPYIIHRILSLLLKQVSCITQIDQMLLTIFLKTSGSWFYFSNLQSWRAACNLKPLEAYIK